MTGETPIIGLAQWLQTPPGQCLLAWEQAQLDQAVTDLFGFHALQMGLPQLQALRANRMPDRWVACGTFGDEGMEGGDEPLAGVEGMHEGGGQRPMRLTSLCCAPEALPFADQSLDLVVLPHTLERAEDPHRSLAEVDRVLRPEGRVVILGLNPVSLWGLRQRLGHGARWMGLCRHRPLYLPAAQERIGYWRLRDWLRLLNFELEVGRMGCYRAPLSTERWLARYAWMERVGAHWWPVLGAAYFIVAVKRVRGMRLVGLERASRASAPVAAPAAVVGRLPTRRSVGCAGRHPSAHKLEGKE